MALLPSDKPASLIKRGMGVKQTMPPQKMPPQTDPPEKDPKPVGPPGPPVNDTWDMSNVPPGMVRRGGQLFRLPRQAPPQMGEPSMKPPRPAPGMESYLRPPGSEAAMAGAPGQPPGPQAMAGGGPGPMQGPQAMMGRGPSPYRRGRGAAVGSGMGNLGDTPGVMGQMAGPSRQMSGGPAQVSGPIQMMNGGEDQVPISHPGYDAWRQGLLGQVPSGQTPGVAPTGYDAWRQDMLGQVPSSLSQVYDPVQSAGAPSFGMPQMQNRRIRPPRDRWY